VVMAVESQVAFEELHGGLSALRPEDVKSWEAMWDAYELDHGKPNPYENPRTGTFPSITWGERPLRSMAQFPYLPYLLVHFQLHVHFLFKSLYPEISYSRLH
jgi:hypothetical protein